MVDLSGSIELFPAISKNKLELLGDIRAHSIGGPVTHCLPYAKLVLGISLSDKYKLNP
jgi:hypothetical protein